MVDRGDQVARCASGGSGRKEGVTGVRGVFDYEEETVVHDALGGEVFGVHVYDGDEVDGLLFS